MMELISKNWYKRNNKVILKKLEYYVHVHSYTVRVDISLNKKEKRNIHVFV